ncbi:MAG: OmpA family protein [Acidobacteria bacterium]|nr:OmpA family protein [Acidobacteriota bacterium]
MKEETSFAKVAALVVLALGIVGAASGCATKKYVRTTVETTTSESAARLDAKIDEQGNKLDATSNQVQELNSVTRDHTGKITTLDSNLQQVDSKTQQAMNIGQEAKGTAEKAVGEVSTLEQKFQNRNDYRMLSEEKVRFAFNSAKLDDQYKQVLDGLAEQIKSDPNAILVMEGRTDATGDDTYNIELGEKRAEAVYRYLVVEKGVPIHRIHKISFGEENPLAPNDSREGRSENRAVIMRILSPSIESQSAAAGQKTISEVDHERLFGE